jgi:hypothetical protein
VRAGGPGKNFQRPGGSTLTAAAKKSKKVSSGSSLGFMKKI